MESGRGRGRFILILVVGVFWCCLDDGSQGDEEKDIDRGALHEKLVKGVVFG